MTLTDDGHEVASGALLSVVMPVLNAMRYLERTVPPILAAVAGRNDMEVIFVDNGSSDGSLEYLLSMRADRVAVLEGAGLSVSALRNLGVREASGSVLSFIDSDCLIDGDYFETALATLEATGSAATGCLYDLPVVPSRLEEVWQDLHFVAERGDVQWLAAGNFVVRRTALTAVGGFDERLVTGEDAAICARLREVGLRIYSNPDVRVRHLGNPQSFAKFYRQQVWHGLGALGTVNLRVPDKPFLMTVAHLAVVLGATVNLLFGGASLAARLAEALVAQIMVPAITVAYRMRGARLRGGQVPDAIVLYCLYYWARVEALVILMRGGASRYRK